MKNKKEYEKHLAEQLNQLPAPGSAQEHWPAMKALLDRDMPEGGAAGRWKRPGTWGLVALVIGILFMAAWYYTPSSSQTPPDVQSSSSSISPVSAANSETKAASKSVNPTEEENTKATPSAPSANPVTGTASTARSVSADAEKDKEADAIVANPEFAEKKTLATTEKKNVSSASVNSSSSRKQKEVVLSKKKKGNPAAGTALISTSDIPASASEVIVTKRTRKSVSGIGEKNEDNNAGAAFISLPDSRSERSAKSSLPRVPARVPLGKAMVPAEDSLHNNYAYALMPEPAPAPPRSRFPKETDRTRALKNRVVGTGEDKNFVFGLSLPLALPINDQKALAYNFNGGMNKITDYLPAPHVQYHFNDRSFLQTELHFFAPQYVRPALVFQETKPMNTGNFLYKTNSIYTEKLYYFSVPVSAYYSPFRNFYMGTGLQFSSLISGIARYEERGLNAMGPASGGQLLSSTYKKFRNDKVSALLNRNEFRVLVDANYYWKKFTMGMRYNQALGNFVSLQVNPFTPYYADRNRSLQFYLRYNLWENQKKKPAIMAYRW